MRSLVSTVALALALAAPAPGGDDGAAPLRWIAVGGGAEPRSTQVSLEQDVALARKTLGERGRVLFAGGRDAFSVQVLERRRRRRRRALLLRVADILDPLEGRDAHYRKPDIAVDGPATRPETIGAIESALRPGTEPLLLFFATHGDIGEAPRDNGVSLWGGSVLTVADLAALLDEKEQRPVRLVVSACYSGGFAELAFAGADPERGAARADRCGLFAAEWDDMSSGCDPDPNRRSQEGYAIHFLNGLRGLDRNGKRLPRAEIDLDGDGRISLLEAHTRARIASTSFGVPTSTSERWLRAVAPPSGEGEPFPLPEERAVVSALGKRLRLPDEAAARERLAKIETQLRQTDQRLRRLEEEEEERLADLRIALLEHWPVLDDPWHPDFRKTFGRGRDEIDAFLARSAPSRAYRQKRNEADRSASDLGRQRMTAGHLRRVIRAYDTMALAGRLHARGGADWEHYLRLLACERSVP